MKNRILINIGVLATAAAVFFCVSGCSSVPSQIVNDSGEVVRVEKPLGVANTLRFEDVPTPAGFNMIRDQSFIYQDSSIRVGLLRYSGHPNSSQVVSFFKAQMPLYNWKMINVVEFGNVNLNFIKADESCIITIEPLKTRTILSVVISPRTGSISAGSGSASRKERY